jgi:hypothetical protein
LAKAIATIRDGNHYLDEAMKNFIRKERKFRYRIPSSFGRKSCPNCEAYSLYRYYEGPIDEYCYECSWKKMRQVSR